MLRTALALSALTGKAFRMTNIRGSRPQPGLKPQHYTCVKTIQKLTKAKTDAEQGSTEITFIPEEYKPKTTKIDIGTAGSITLLLQSLLIPSLFSEKKHSLTIKGGTDVQWSMPIDYFQNVLVPQLRRFAEIEVQTQQRGYYPKGGGEVKITIKPNKERTKIKITEQGELIRINGISHASKDLEKADVAERMANAAKQTLEQPASIRTEYRDTQSTGCGITLWATYSKNKDDIDYLNPIILGTDNLGQRGKPAEQIGKETAEQLHELMKSGAPVDEHLADNLIPFMGLCPGSEILTTEITDHIKTNIQVTEAFLEVKFKIEGTKITSQARPA